MPNDNIKYALSQGLELRSVKNILGIPIGEERVYTIERVLGQGGFGITYLASRRIRIDNTPHTIFFAVKEFFVKRQCWREANDLQMKYSPAAKSEIDECKKGFIDEAKRLNKICAENINIVNVNEVFEANDTAYYVMEFLSGGSLRDIIRKSNGAITEKKALSFILPIAKAVDHIHSQHKLLHCDISPDNIMLRENDNGSFTPVLIDFGESLHFNSKGELTTIHNAIGAKEGFAPIEQYRGVTNFDSKIDIYALGATLFCLLTGKKPISAFDIDSEYISKKLPSAVSQPIRDAILQAMAKNKENRTATVTDFIKKLGEEIMETLPDELSEGDVLINKGKAYVVISVARKKSYYIQYKIVVKDEIRQDSLSGPTKLPICYLYEFFAEGNHERQKNKSVINKGDIKKAQQQFLNLCKKITRNQIDNEFKEVSESDWSTFVANGTQYIVGYYHKKPFPWKKIFTYAGIVIGVILLLYGFADRIKLVELKRAAEQGDAKAQYKLGLYYDKQGDNYDEAAKWYQKAAEQGYAPAQYNLGVCYYNGEGVDKNYEEGVKWYRKAAKQGDVDAQYFLGVCYYNGEGVEQNYEEAVEWLRKAAEQGDAMAQNRLGVCYYKGKGVKQDYIKAAKWYQKAAEQGYAPAQYNLGVCYYNGEGVKQDYAEAAKWYQKAAEQGDAMAQENLARCYSGGKGVKQDDGEAVKWLRKSAEQGNTSAQYMLGVFYVGGTGIEKDTVEAAKWYQKAAEQGYAPAQHNLGNCYYNGEGVKQDYAEAAKWYQKAAEQGYAPAQYNLGVCYNKGEGVKQDYAEAAKWYQKAAEQGDVKAQYDLGVCYYNGKGVKQDYIKAVKWFEKAVEQGDAKAQNHLGVCYETGNGVKQGYNEAVQWYRKAAEQGNAMAQSNLGVCYSYGTGVSRDYSEAAKWYRKAAEQGLAMGQYNLGICYEKGQGVKQDYAEATKLFQKAAEQGYEPAKEHLNLLLNK